MYLTRTDGEFICAFSLLENWYYWGRHKVGETEKGRRKPETPQPRLGSGTDSWFFLCLLVCRLDVDIFWLRFCTLPLDACLVCLKGRFSSLWEDVVVLGEPRRVPGSSCRKRGQRGQRGQQDRAGSRLPSACLLRCCPSNRVSPSNLAFVHDRVTVNILCLQYGKINTSSTIFKRLYDESGWDICVHLLFFKKYHFNT